MKLLKPVPFRLKPEQDDWLKERADKQGHGNKALFLRMLLDREMRRTSQRTVRKETRS